MDSRSESASMLRNVRSIGVHMPHVLRIIFPLVVCAQILGCIGSHSPYPSEWPKIQESSDNECNNISGKYSDLDTTRKISLASMLLRQAYDPKYDRATSHIVIVQTDKIVEVKVTKYNQETIQDKKLTRGKDIFCTKGVLHISRPGEFAAGEGVIGQVWGDFNLLMGEDGSLIVHATSRGWGCYAIPFGVSGSEYYRFERWRY